MSMMSYNEFLTYALHQHDVVCNQKYGPQGVPYSVHLRMVLRQVLRFAMSAHRIRGEQDFDHLMMIGCGHDLIEDARVSYNDLRQMVPEYVAEGIFLCTEFRGRNRKERKPDVFYLELAQHSGAVYVKLCDIVANSLYSLATHSSMFDRYKDEWPHVCLLLNDYDQPDKLRPMFDFLRSVYGIQAYPQ